MNNLRATPVEIKWHSGLPIYASEAFLKTEGERFGWIGGLDDRGDLRCVLPYAIIRKPGFRMVRFWTATIPMAGEIDLEEERSFLNSVVEHFRSGGADLILPSANGAVFRTYPDGAVAAPYGTFIKNLDRPEEVLWSEILHDYRYNIRKAETAGVEIKCGPNYLDVAYQLVAETMRRSGATFMSYSKFERRVLGFGENVRIFVAEHGGLVQGCIVAPFSLYAVYSAYAGSKPRPVKGAMQMLHWQAMRQFRAMGVKLFDFYGVRINPEKGSKQEGMANYKRRFGCRLVQGYLWKYPLRPLKFAAYGLGARLLMGGDVVDQERRRLSSV